MITSCRVYSTEASRVQARGIVPGQLEEAAKRHKQGSIRVSSPSLSAFLKGLSHLLMLGMQGNELHDRNISPQVLST